MSFLKILSFVRALIFNSSSLKNFFTYSLLGLIFYYLSIKWCLCYQTGIIPNLSQSASSSISYAVLFVNLFGLCIYNHYFIRAKNMILYSIVAIQCDAKYSTWTGHFERTWRNTNPEVRMSQCDSGYFYIC